MGFIAQTRSRTQVSESGISTKILGGPVQSATFPLGFPPMFGGFPQVPGGVGDTPAKRVCMLQHMYTAESLPIYLPVQMSCVTMVPGPSSSLPSRQSLQLPKAYVH